MNRDQLVLGGMAIELFSARPQARFLVWLEYEDRIVSSIRADNPSASAAMIRDHLLSIGRALSSRLNALERRQRH